MESHLSLRLNIKHVVLALSIVFVILSAIHYFSLRPLWLDEDFILKNMQQFNGAELFRPLEYSQAFPRVHLILLQQFAEVFNNHLLALRFFSFIFMLAAFAIWANIYRRVISNGLILGMVLLAFVASYKMSYYAAELKPYSMDVLVIAIYTWFCVELKGFTERKNIGEMIFLSAILPWFILFSYTGLLGVWIVAYNLLFLSVTYRQARVPAAVNILSLLLVLGVFYQFDLRYSIGMQGLHSYWQSYFIDTSSAAGFFDTLGDGLKKIATYWYGNSKVFIRLAVIFVPFVFYAMIKDGLSSIKENKGRISSIDAFGLILFVQLLILGILRMYPFTGERITLFIAPFVFYYTVKAMAAIRLAWLRSAFLGYFIFFCLVCLSNTFWLHWQEFSSIF